MMADGAASHCTVWVLVVTSGALFAYQHIVHDPITCHLPAYFLDNHITYAHKACWNQDSYKLRAEESVLEDNDPVSNQKLLQKLPLLLLLQALLMYIPTAIWKLLQKNPATSLPALLSTAKQCYSAKDSTYSHLINVMGRTLAQHLSDIRCNNYLSVSAITVRILSLAASVVNVIVLIQLAGPYDYLSLFSSQNVQESSVRDNTTTTAYIPFPRVVLCSYGVEQEGRVYSYTVQCLLEHDVAIYVLAAMVAWLCVVSVVNLLQLVASVTCTACGDWSSVKTSLQVRGVLEVEMFTAMMGRDGVLIYQLLCDVSSHAVAADVITEAYNYYMQLHSTAGKETVM